MAQQSRDWRRSGPLGRDDQSRPQWHGGHYGDEEGISDARRYWSEESRGFVGGLAGSSGNRDENESRHGSGRGTRAGSNYGSRGFSSESRGQSWGDRQSSLEGASSYGEQGQSFRGRGPKEYQRSDERLREVVCEQLLDDPTIDASDISVSVSNGTVTLTGMVNDLGSKYQVEEMVSECGGVSEVENQLRVQRGQAQPGND